MSAPPKFREGDAVRHDDHNIEGRITRVSPDGIDVRFEGTGQSFAKFVHAERLRGNPGFVTLLRRRVELGDSIRVRDGYDKRFLKWIVRGEALTAVAPINVVELDRKGGHIHGIRVHALEHADGTPIDWTKPDADYDAPITNPIFFEPPGINVVMSFGEMVDAIHPADAPKLTYTFDEFSARVGIEVKADPFCPPGTYAIVSKGRVFTGTLADAIQAGMLNAELLEERALRRKFEKRANELSDLCGGLATKCSECVAERDELLVENANLRRRVEHLERVANAEKTAKGFAPPSMLRVRRPR